MSDQEGNPIVISGPPLAPPEEIVSLGEIILGTMRRHQPKSTAQWSGLGDIEPEVNAAIKLILWWLSVGRNGATFGQQLLCLKFKTGTPASKLWLIGAVTIAYSYLKAKCFTGQGNRAVPSIFKHTELAVNALNLLSFVALLQRGESPAFLEYVLGVKPVSTLKLSERTVGYSFMVKELWWNAALDFSCLLFSSLNDFSVNSFWNSILTPANQIRVPLDAPRPKFTCEAKCVICSQRPIIPLTIGCKHFFCYYCSVPDVGSLFVCPNCNLKGNLEYVTE